jgi:hypothetical protein
MAGELVNLIQQPLGQVGVTEFIQIFHDYPLYNPIGSSEKLIVPTP